MIVQKLRYEVALAPTVRNNRSSRRNFKRNRPGLWRLMGLGEEVEKPFSGGVLPYKVFALLRGNNFIVYHGIYNPPNLGRCVQVDWSSKRLVILRIV